MRAKTALAAVIVCLTAVCSVHVSASAEQKIIVASDIHYIAPSVTDGGESYQQVLKNSDSKFMIYSEEICEAFFDEVIEAKPEALLLTGDLTFNGAVISHETLASHLYRIKQHGIPVLVITGNHDVYNTNAAEYHGSSITPLPSATTDSFAEIYAEFGLKDALSVAPDSLSYAYQLNDSLRILAFDLNTDHDFCGLSNETLAWAESQLQEAAASDIRVIACGHQNIFQHSIFRSGYVIDGADRLSSLLREYHVPLYLSGHLHIQHILEEDGLTEIAGSALCSYPCQYGVLRMDGDILQYETVKLDMAGWADKNSLSDPVFQDFQAASAAYMSDHLKVETPDSEESGRMTEYVRKLNLAYFSGDLRDIRTLDPDGRLAALWMEAGDLFSLYVASVCRESGRYYNVWSGCFS